MHTKHNKSWKKQRNKRKFNLKRVRISEIKPKWGLRSIVSYIFNPQQKSFGQKRKEQIRRKKDDSPKAQP